MKRLRLPAVTVLVTGTILTVVAVCTIALSPAHGDDVQADAATADILGRLLDEVGFTREDLGYRPRGYWSRFPLDVPYRLPAFDDLFAEPLRLFDYATTMGNAVELYLEPSYADSVDDGLYKLLHNLGVDRKLGGFRTYSANPLPAPSTAEPLVTACEQLYLQAGAPLETYTFGIRSGAPSVADTVRAQTGALPDTVRVVLAELIVNLHEAVRWRDLAFRRADREAMRASMRLRDLASTQGDGQRYYPQLDDVARTIDLPSLHYAGLKTAAAAERAERQLSALRDRVPAGLDCEIPTPYGAIRLISPDDKAASRRHRDAARDERRRIDVSRTLCVIDFGASCIWRGTAGSAVTIDNPISVLIDLAGDDDYGEAADDDGESGAGGSKTASDLPPCAGVGLCGIGVVIDSGGNDHYHGSIYAQGAGLFGIGILLDRQGNDIYRAAESAQGCGYFGIGLCLDGTGDDSFYLYGDGQGMGGIGGGIGVLASWGGDDHYTAEPLAAVFDRGDYHSDHVINGNNAQGAGFGRRGDGSDGHAWAGGLGAIIDIHGDDRYESGNWTLGVGYWFGTGIALDRQGDDHYRSCYFTQASGAHFCNAILIDEGGDDQHELYETAGAALAFGWDFTNALLINRGGNDTYRAERISLGLAQIRSNALLIDIGGDDLYDLPAGASGMGAASWRPDYVTPKRTYAYMTYASSLGALIDIGGDDEYRARTEEDARAPHPLAGNDRTWLQPAPDDSTYGARNFGVGIDVEEGVIPEFDRWR